MCISVENSSIFEGSTLQNNFLLLNSVGRNENQTRQFIENCCCQGVCRHHFHLGRDSLVGRGMGKCQRGVGVFRCGLVQAVSKGNFRYGCTHDGTWLALIWNLGPKLGKLTILNETWPLGAELLDYRLPGLALEAAVSERRGRTIALG